MAGDLNKWIGVGRLTKAPELTYTPSGTAVCKFSIASNAVYYQNSEKKEKVNYFNLVALGKTGESIVEFCRKGMRLGIEGRLSWNSWTDKHGSKYSAIEIIVDTFQFLDTKKDGKPAAESSHDEQPPLPDEEPPAGACVPVDDLFEKE